MRFVAQADQFRRQISAILAGWRQGGDPSLSSTLRQVQPSEVSLLNSARKISWQMLARTPPTEVNSWRRQAELPADGEPRSARLTN
jgi:hypothetical protein